MYSNRIRKALAMPLLGICICWCLMSVCEMGYGANNPTVDSKSDISNHALLYTSLGLNLLCLILIIVLFRRQKYFDEEIQRVSSKYETLTESNKQIEEELSNSIKQNKNQLEKKINDLSQSRKREIETEKPNPISGQTLVPNSPQAPKVLYASQADESSNTFWEVKEEPSDTTIYELQLTGESEAKFETYTGAKNKIIGEPGNLEGASEPVSQAGRQDLETTEAGLAEKMPNGKWKITKKAQIKFK